MKLKSLILAAAIAAASFSGVANAAIDGVVVGNTNATNTDLVFFIYDTENDLSYVQNLDVNYKDMILPTPGNFSGSFDLNASQLNVFSGSNTANLVWGMAATGLDYLDVDGSTLGYISNRQFPNGQDLGFIDGMNQKFVALGLQINLSTAIGTANALSATGAAGSLISGAVKEFALFDQAANVSTSQNLWFVHTNAEYVDVPSELASVQPWKLNLATANVASTPTPLPAAAWLMFSALMGLGGIARRRNAKV